MSQDLAVNLPQDTHIQKIPAAELNATFEHKSVENLFVFFV